MLSPQMRIMDNKLFHVEPKHGKISPGQSQTVTLSYCHDFAGTDRLPVLFKITQGREILVSSSHFIVRSVTVHATIPERLFAAPVRPE